MDVTKLAVSKLKDNAVAIFLLSDFPAASSNAIALSS